MRKNGLPVWTSATSVAGLANLLACHSSCETELEELMHQIDIMVNNKKIDWEKQVKDLEQKLEAKDEEVAKSRSALDQKNYEVGILYKKLEGFEKEQCEVVQNYEKQLQALKYQLYKLKKSYEKLHYSHMKNLRHETTGTSPEQEKSKFEIAQLTQKLEEYNARSKEWERQRMMYQNHLKSLNEQRNTLTEKYDALQRQSQSYQEQLSSRTQLQDEAITNNQSEIRRLRCQLDTSQETIRNSGVIIENLKTAVKEITLSRNSLKDENQQLLQELKKCQKHCQKMESQLSEARIQLHAQDDLMRAVELEQKQMQKEIPDMKQCKNLQGNELRYIQEAKLYTKCKALLEEQANKKFKLCSQDKTESDRQEKKSKNTELQKLKTDISELNTKLNQKDITIATIGDKVCRLERELELKEKENLKQKNKEFLQMENTSLSELLEDLENKRAMALQSINETNKETCDVSTDSLKSDCERLPVDTNNEQGMQEQLLKRLDQFLRLSDKKVAQNNTQKHRSFNEESNHNLQNLTTSHIETLYRECEFGTVDHGCNAPFDNYLIDIECLPDLYLGLHDDYHAQQDFDIASETDILDISSIFVCDQQKGTAILPSSEESFMSAAEKFLLEENMRARDFEKVLNSHIETMQRHSETTLAKYKR
ncbi:deuterosome assembly protein 1 [Discoglossus pictus]